MLLLHGKVTCTRQDTHDVVPSALLRRSPGHRTDEAATEMGEGEQRMLRYLPEAHTHTHTLVDNGDKNRHRHD